MEILLTIYLIGFYVVLASLLSWFNKVDDEDKEYMGIFVFDASIFWFIFIIVLATNLIIESLWYKKVFSKIKFEIIDQKTFKKYIYKNEVIYIESIGE